MLAKTVREMPSTELGVSVLEKAQSLTPQQRMEKRVERENLREGTLHLADGYNCDKCRNKGMIIIAKEYDGLWQDVQRECQCMKVRRNIMNLKRSGLESVVKEYRLDNFKTEKPHQEMMLDTAKRYLTDRDAKWVAYLGASGSGKTHLCSAIAIELLRRGKELKYMLWKDESRKIKNDNFDGGGNLIDTYKSVEVLYIDDLFKTGKTDGKYQKPTAGDVNIAFEIINARVTRNLITIISSENTMDELVDIDEAVGGRIKQMCGDYCLNISRGKAKNYRMR